MKKILMISFRFPWPEWRGGFNLRVLRFAKILARNYSLDLLTLIRTKEEKRNVKNLEKEKIFNNVFYFSHSGIKEYENAFFGLFSDLPLQINYYFSKSAVDWLEENYKKYDLLYFNTIRTVQRGKKLKNIPKVIDLIDAVSLNYLEARKWNTFFWRLIYKIEIPRLIRYEREILKSNLFDKIFISSEFDKKYLIQNSKIQIPSSKLVVIPNGVREELLRKNREQEAENKKEENWISFFGKMDTQPNQDAVCFFAKKIFPKVLKIIPNCYFYIIGINPSARVRSLEKIKNVKVTGYVKNPYEILQKSKVIVAPLRFGAGIQNKVLEAMALKKAVVSSPIAVRGILGIENGKHLEVVDITNPGLWAEKVIELLQDFNKRNEIGSQARKFIEENYRWEKIEEKLLSSLKEVFLHQDPVQKRRG